MSKNEPKHQNPDLEKLADDDLDHATGAGPKMASGGGDMQQGGDQTPGIAIGTPQDNLKGSAATSQSGVDKMGWWVTTNRRM